MAEVPGRVDTFGIRLVLELTGGDGEKKEAGGAEGDEEDPEVNQRYQYDISYTPTMFFTLAFIILASAVFHHRFLIL